MEDQTEIHITAYMKQKKIEPAIKVRKNTSSKA
jgi:hypothetical protein